MDQIGEVLAPLRDEPVEPREVAVDRPEAAEQLAELFVAAVEAVARADKQQLQVGLTVAVERAEDLVEVDVGGGIRGRDRVALLVAAGSLRPRVELEEHVL